MAEELEGGADPDVATARARERFGDERELARDVRSAWSAERPDATRLWLPILVSTVTWFALFAWNRAHVERSLAPYLFYLPSALVLAIPIGTAIGLGLAFTIPRPRSSARAPGSDRASIMRALSAAGVAAIIAFATYLVVPVTNARYDRIKHVRSGAYPNFRNLSLPALTAMVEPDAGPQPSGRDSWLLGLSPPWREWVAKAARFEIQKRFAVPFACVALGLAGLSCATWCARLRFAPAFGVLGATFAFVLWELLYAVAEASFYRPGRLYVPWLAENVPVPLLAWVPNIVLVALAIAALGARRALPPVAATSG